MRQTGNRFRKVDEKPYFSGTNNGPVQKIYLAACAAAHLEVLLLNDTTEERGFFPQKACIFIVFSWPGLYFTLRIDAVGRRIV